MMLALLGTVVTVVRFVEKAPDIKAFPLDFKGIGVIIDIPPRRGELSITTRTLGSRRPKTDVRKQLPLLRHSCVSRLEIIVRMNEECVVHALAESGAATPQR